VPVTSSGGAGWYLPTLDLRRAGHGRRRVHRHRRACLRVKALTDPSLGFALLSKSRDTSRASPGHADAFTRTSTEIIVSSDRTLSMRPSSVAPRGNLNDLTPIVHRVVERIGETTTYDTGPRTARRSVNDFPMRSVQYAERVRRGRDRDIDEQRPGEGTLRHSIRDVGAVIPRALPEPCRDLVGVRGPFGSDWLWSPPGRGRPRPRDTIVVAEESDSPASWSRRGIGAGQ